MRSGLWDSINEREIGLWKLWTYIIKPGFVPKPNVTGGRFSVYYNQLWMRPSPVLIVLLKKAVEFKNFKISSKLKYFWEIWSDICCHRLSSFFFFLLPEKISTSFSSKRYQLCFLSIWLYFLISVFFLTQQVGASLSTRYSTS